MTKTPHILIVEDDTWLAEQFVRTLTNLKLRVETAPHALMAMDMIDTDPPAVLVLDVLLAGPNAFALLHELQSHSDLATIPVIICTNSADQLASEDIEAYGVRQVLDKTKMTPEDLVAAVKKALL